MTTTSTQLEIPTHGACNALIDMQNWLDKGYCIAFKTDSTTKIFHKCNPHKTSVASDKIPYIFVHVKKEPHLLTVFSKNLSAIGYMPCSCSLATAEPIHSFLVKMT